MNDYLVTIRIDSGQYLEAKSKSEAVELVKDLWQEEFNIQLKDSEIIDVQMVTS
jgi:hypothetical protein